MSETTRPAQGLEYGQGYGARAPMMTIFLAGYNSDTVEGRGPVRWVSAFTTRELAEQVAATLPGVMGTPNTTKPRELPLYASMEEYESRQEYEARLKALAKLTEEEKRLLGLTTPTETP